MEVCDYDSEGQSETGPRKLLGEGPRRRVRETGPTPNWPNEHAAPPISQTIGYLVFSTDRDSEILR